MNTVPIFYRSEQTAPRERVRSFSPSSYKPALCVMEYLKLSHTTIRTDWEPLYVQDLARVHDEQHVKAVLAGRAADGFGHTDPVIAETFRYTTGSFVAAARHVAKHGGIAHSPTSGFHHAGPDTCQGFCTFNGLALAARTLTDGTHRVGILDLDMHYGNGTAECLKLNAGGSVGTEMDDSEQILQVSRTWPDGTSCLRDLRNVYLPLLLEHLERGATSKGVLLYQAGADSHKDDPFGGYLSTDEMFERDTIVFEWCAKNRIPCAYNLAGGYQKDSKDDPTPVVRLHVNTMRAATAAVTAR